MSRPTTQPAGSRRSRRGAPKEIQIATGASHDGAPLYTRIYRQLREHILSGLLPSGSPLPSGRALAADLGVSRNTVESAFDQLVAEGYIVRRIGAGSLVAENLQEAAPFAQRTTSLRTPPSPPARLRPARLSQRGTLLESLGGIEDRADSASGPWSTDIDTFPRAVWNRLLARNARRRGIALLQSAPQAGLPELRRQIAEYASLARGLRCDAEQVVIVSSTQQALDLIARVVLDPGDVACIEEPGYPSARAAFLAAGARLHPVPVDDEGLIADQLPPARGRQLLYLTPSHQFPLGVPLALARRLAVLAWAAKTRTWVIEDDYDSEFRSESRPLAALQGLDQHDRVLYIGTYNKVLFPGLRLAYIIAPRSLIAPLAAARRMSDGTSSPLLQATLAAFMASGQFTAFLRQARLRYAERRHLLVTRATHAWGNHVRLGPSATGLHLVVHLPRHLNETQVVESVRHLGMGVSPLSRYYVGRRKKSGLLLSYGASSDAAIIATVDRLARIFVRESRGKRENREAQGRRG
ncbi:MAG: PLP-dependent aminotransferase family protein [Candidatus Eisenbacteria bacterium]|nr:PLP-dependent aminotransferase family protein [Candidatus Eisenbacteria bacterium]